MRSRRVSASRKRRPIRAERPIIEMVKYRIALASSGNTFSSFIVSFYDFGSRCLLALKNSLCFSTAITMATPFKTTSRIRLSSATAKFRFSRYPSMCLYNHLTAAHYESKRGAPDPKPAASWSYPTSKFMFSSMGAASILTRVSQLDLLFYLE